MDLIIQYELHPNKGYILLNNIYLGFLNIESVVQV